MTDKPIGSSKWLLPASYGRSTPDYDCDVSSDLWEAWLTDVSLGKSVGNVLSCCTVGMRLSRTPTSRAFNRLREPRPNRFTKNSVTTTSFCLTTVKRWWLSITIFEPQNLQFFYGQFLENIVGGSNSSLKCVLRRGGHSFCD